MKEPKTRIVKLKRRDGSFAYKPQVKRIRILCILLEARCWFDINSEGMESYFGAPEFDVLAHAQHAIDMFLGDIVWKHKREFVGEEFIKYP